MVRRSGGTPSRSARPGSSVAPKPPVTARLTSISAASIAGSRPDEGHRHERPAAARRACARPSIGRNRTTLAVTRDAADIARDAASSRTGGAARGRRAKADRALEGARGRRRSDDIRDRDVADRRPRLSGRRRSDGQRAPRDLEFGQARCRAPSARWRCDRGCGWRNPCRRRRCRRAEHRRPGSPSRRASPSRRRRSGACW